MLVRHDVDSCFDVCGVSSAHAAALVTRSYVHIVLFKVEEESTHVKVGYQTESISQLSQHLGFKYSNYMNEFLLVL